MKSAALRAAGVGAAAVCCVLAAAALTAPAPAQALDEAPATGGPGRQGLRRAAAGFRPAAVRADRLVTASVLLAAPSVLERGLDAGHRLSAAQRSTARQRVRDSQAGVRTAVTRRRGRVLRALQDAVNAVTVRMPASTLPALAALPGVTDVQPARLVQPGNRSAVAFTGATTAWQQTGRTGAGVRIAVIDTGIDYHHADFGGSGDPADYSSDDRTEAGSGFPSAKVVGGHDLVGDGYDPSSTDPAAQLARPDPDPLDCAGHGTHVAGTAAGYGVTSAGATYRGPYTAAALDGLRIGPGVAPEASLLAYKVFGCTGGTTDADIAAAINLAVIDGADVINLSLGGSYGGAAGIDAAAADAASRAGTVVVAASGNDGHGAYLTGSPASASRVICVAALDASAGAGTAGPPAGFTSAGPRSGDQVAKPDVAAPGVLISSAGKGTGSAASVLSGTSMATPHVAGAAALAVQAHPGWSAEQVKAALMNTASASSALVDGNDPLLLGAGVVQPAKAVAATVLALTTTGRSALSFGHDVLSGAHSQRQRLTLHNTGDTAATYTVVPAFTGGSLGATLSVSPSRITVPAGATVTATVTLALSKVAVAALPDADDSVAGVVRTVHGVLRATLADGTGPTVIRVPFVAVPRGRSSVGASRPRLTGSARAGSARTGRTTVRNSGVHAGTAELFALGATDGIRSPVQSTDLRTIGVGVLPGSALRLPNTQRTVSFAINVSGRWSNPAQNEIDVLVDTDRDGEADRIVAGVDVGLVGGDRPTGELGAVVIDPADSSIVDSGQALAPMNSSTALLRVPSAALGLSAKRPAFRYSVLTAGPDGVVADRTAGWSGFDAFSPPQRTGTSARLPPGRSATMTLSSKVSRPRWLLVTLDDADGAAQGTIVTPR